MTLDDRRLIEISVQADREAVDDLMGLFSRYCSGGAAVDELRQAPEWPPQERVLVKGYLEEGDQETLHKLEIALLLLSKTGVISEPTRRLLEAADWAESWKAFFPPLPIGERFVVVPSWVEYEVPRRAAAALSGPRDGLWHRPACHDSALPDRDGEPARGWRAGVGRWHGFGHSVHRRLRFSEPTRSTRSTSTPCASR